MKVQPQGSCKHRFFYVGFYFRWVNVQVRINASTSSRLMSEYEVK